MTTSAVEIDMALVKQVFLDSLRAGLAQREAGIDPERLEAATALAGDTIQGLVEANQFDAGLADQIGAAYSQLLTKYPEAANLSREDLEEVFREIAAQAGS